MPAKQTSKPDSVRDRQTGPEKAAGAVRAQDSRWEPALGNRAIGGLFQERIGPRDDPFEQEADRVAAAVSLGGLLTSAIPGGPSGAGTIQRKCAECEREEEEEKIRRAPKEGDAEAPAAAEATAPEQSPTDAPDAQAAPSESAPAGPETPTLLVDDDAEAVPGQMRRSEFMAAMRAEVCASADAAMAGTGNDTKGCPWVDYWFGYYEGKDAAHIEDAIHRYAPETAGASSAADYITMVAARVGHAVDVWATTGEVTGVPEEASAQAGAGILGDFGGMFFKARRGGPRSANPISVRRQLGGGQPLPGGVRSRMESAFGVNFGGVRLHADSKGAELSDRLNARAFTVGEHVAFGPGEFRPGTIAGDALIAHELAHVVQQGGAESMPAAGKSPESTGRLEVDADRSAVAAVSSLWARGKDAARNVMPAIRSGLQLSRCSKGDKTPTSSTATPAPPSGKIGTWSFTQSNTDGSATTPYSSNIVLTFSPEKTAVNCGTIAFVQVLRHYDNSSKATVVPIQKYKDRMSASGWTVDRVEQRKFGWYGFNNDGSPSGTITPGSSPSPLTDAVLRDRPTNHIKESTIEFETCAICKSGTEAGTAYSCYSWGLQIDGTYKVTSLPDGEHKTPSAEFAAAIQGWNAQAKSANKNDPNQQELGPFKNK